MSVMLINKDPSNDATVSLSYNGFTPASGAPTVFSYLKNGSSIGSATTGSATTQTVPAYSVVVVQLHKGSGGGGGTATCRVTYTKSSEWQGGMVAGVTVANTGTSPVNGWRLTWSFPGDTRVGNSWGANLTQNGQAVTAVNADWDATIPAGGSQSFGFSATWTSNNASPTSFALNGSSCSMG